MRHTASPAWTAWAAASSLLLHALIWVGLGATPPRARERPEKTEVSFEITKAPEISEPERPPEPLPEPRAAPLERRAVARAEPDPREAPAPAPAPETRAPEPIDMSGVTLTNDLGAGFSMHAGNGLARKGALRVPASLARTVPREPARSALGMDGPRVVSLGDLSARPTPPPLQSALEQNYPPDARRRGLGGTATVRARIDADGVVRSVASAGESAPGFGEACRRTLRGSRWSAPRDRGGNTVATEIRYTCRFVVTQ